MLSPHLRAIVQRFKAVLEDRWHDRILDVRVFGSVARGDAREDSDLDVFVMVDERDEEIVRSIRDAAWDVTYESELSLPISPRIMSRAHFAELTRLERRLANDILTEGISV